MDFDDVLHWIGLGFLVSLVFVGVFALAVCVVMMVVIE
jgi:hypothetical protein